MVTSPPGDLLASCWPSPQVTWSRGRLADLTVIAARHPDPWKNLVLAAESDMLLVLVGGEPRYGTRDLMRASGRRNTTSVSIGRH